MPAQLTLPVDPTETARLAQAQLDAYNAHDIDAFCACFAEDIEARTLPADTLLFRGREGLRARYAPYFAQQRPQARLTVPRQVLGAMAIDNESVVLADGQTLEAIALYAVAGGLIEKFWLIRP